MKLINSKVELLPQEDGLNGIYKQIEIAGRTCYKSENNITDTSAETFVQKMINNGHTAMLEHGTVYLRFYNTRTPISEYTIENSSYAADHYSLNPFSKVIQISDNEMLATTNFRVIIENDWKFDLNFICNPSEQHPKRVSVRITCDRGVSHKRFVA